ncbi:MAG: arylamine N-acetyltransferase [Verrucomicrobia bacterium]|nr:arylamine N-acetyltransferase [Verrucomicrobiota bacterium]
MGKIQCSFYHVHFSSSDKQFNMDERKKNLSQISETEISAFLQRIEFSDRIAINSQTLKLLHAAFIAKIPFETLDIFSGKRFSLSLPDLYDKIVARHRGGYCYELNGFFFHVLQKIGFEVSLYCARLYDHQQMEVAASQHMVLAVKLEGLWLVDVGYGNGFIYPLLLDSPEPQQQGHRTFRALDRDGSYLIQEMEGKEWTSWYVFTREPKTVADFEERNHFHQTSERSVFFKKRICMIAHGDERIELVGNALTRRTSSEHHLSMVQEDDIPLLLKNEFDIE